MMNKIQLKQELKQELEAYKKDRKSCKPYMQSMKDMSAWLKSQEK